MTTPDTHHAAAAAHAAAIPPHLAGSLVSLRDMIDAHWPKRDRRSDGGIGDERHQAEGVNSDHNPWLHNTVRAYDFDADGIDAAWLAEQLRLLGHYGDLRLVGGGYVIWDHQITAPDFSHWTPYHGTDPHTSHVHVSVTRNTPAYEYGGIWAFLASKPTPRQQPLPKPTPAAAPAPAPTGHDATGHGDSFRADIGDEGPRVKELQHELNDFAPAYSHLEEDGVYGQHTADVVREFAHREAHDPVTPPPAADVPGLETADGLNVGPRLATALRRDGLRL